MAEWREIEVGEDSEETRISLDEDNELHISILGGHGESGGHCWLNAEETARVLTFLLKAATADFKVVGVCPACKAAPIAFDLQVKDSQ